MLRWQIYVKRVPFEEVLGRAHKRQGMHNDDIVGIQEECYPLFSAQGADIHSLQLSSGPDKKVEDWVFSQGLVVHALAIIGQVLVVQLQYDLT